MKTKIFSLLLLLGAAMTSCTDNWDPDTDIDAGKGNLAKVNLSINNNEKPIDRSSSVDDSNFLISVIDGSGKIVNEWVYREMPEVVELPVGQGYTVKAISHVQQDQAWDMPYFEGISEPFAIANGEITKIGAINCKFANIAVTITFADDMKQIMSDDCKVTVVANDKGILEYSKEETRTGYFRAMADSKTLAATLSGTTVDGEALSVTHTYHNVEAGNHYYINYSIKAPDTDKPIESGTIYVDSETGIVIDTTVDEEALSGNINSSEDTLDDSDRPGQEETEEPEDPNTPDDPNVPTELITFTGTETFDINKVNIPEAGPDYKVTINSYYPIVDVYVNIISNTMNKDMLQGVGLDNEFSLANPGDLASALSESFNFPIEDQIVGQTSVVFDITEFVPLLAIYTNEEHKFKLTVTDEKGNVATQELIFNTNP